jgi:hypothetical protein
MPRYRFDFLAASGATFAMHEIDYADDQAAIVAGHEINGSPSIGACFKIWRDDRLIYHHRNEPPILD